MTTPRETPRSAAAFARARTLMPGGVSSPARACRSVGCDPVFADRAEGAFVWDADGNRYVDYVGAFGPMILGHGHPEVVRAIREQAGRGLGYGMPTEAESELAALVRERIPSCERLRLVSSGTEATMSALRAARGFTRREKIVKLEGCYHGHADFLLVKAGSGAMTFGTPDSAGVTEGAARDTLTAPFNDVEAVRRLFAAEPGRIAAVVLEPVVGNMGVVPPEPGYLEALRELTRDEGALLVFDEVMTGFRVHPGSAQALYGIHPDLTCLGKVAGGGLPVGAYGGRSDVMGVVAPDGPVYQAGTNSGNPLSVAAGLATLRLLTPDDYDRLEALSARLEAGLVGAARSAGVPVRVQRVGSMITPFFTDGPVRRLDDVPATAPRLFGAFFRALRDRGVLVPPSQYEAWFVSAAHTAAIVDDTVAAAAEALRDVATIS